jgi:predicted phage terminase large subunit-like protein
MTQEEKIIKIRKQSEANLVPFRYYLLNSGKDELNPPAYHFDWSDILLKEKDSFAIEGFRESGKGQIVLRAFPLYCLCFPSPDRDYIVLIKQNTDLSSQKLIEIENEYLSNPVLNSNLVEIKQKSARIFSVDVKNAVGEVVNIRIEAYGKGSSIRGLANIDRRPRIVVIDDPQDTEDSKSDTVLENDWRWFLSDVMFLGQHTRIFLIGNNLGEKCILERAIASADELGFQKRRVAIYNENNEPAWPDKFPLVGIEKERENYRKLGQIDVWMRERMCVATSAENRMFNRDDFMRYSYLYVDTIIKNTNIFITIDPASSREKTADWRAMCVNAVTEDNRWIIIDFPYGRWGSDVFIDELFKLVIKWTPYLGFAKRIPVGIEKGEFKNVIEPFIYKEMQRRNIFFDIVPIEHANMGSKLERVKMLAPRFKAHTIYLPETSSWLAELESELLGVTIDSFRSLHDDLVDALAMQFQIAKTPVIQRQNRPGEIEETQPYNPFKPQLAGV